MMMAMTSVITVLTEAESSLLTGSYSGGVAAATGKMGFIISGTFSQMSKTPS
jgi:hypothetical protein